jgi:hypothetical protein
MDEYDWLAAPFEQHRAYPRARVRTLRRLLPDGGVVARVLAERHGRPAQ